MAISKVGLGWSELERDYNTLDAWNTALNGSLEFEEAWCSGDLGSVAVDIPGFPNGALIYGDVEYIGNNHSALAKLGAALTVRSSSGSIQVRDISVETTGVSQTISVAFAGNRLDRVYSLNINGAGSTSAAINCDNGGIAQNCVGVCTNLSTRNVFRIRASASAIDCLGFSATNGFQVTGSVINCFSFGNSSLDMQFITGGTLTNSASEDGTGNITGYTSAELVDFAGGDYRIKQTSDLFALGVGAFFEQGEPSGDVDITPEAGSFSYTGGNVPLLINRALTPQTGVYNYTGGVVDLSISSVKEINPEPGVFSYAGGSVDLLINRELNPESGQFSYAGGQVPLTLSRVITPESGVFSYAGGAVDIEYSADTSISIDPESGVFSYQGGNVDLLINRVINPQPGVYQYQGGSVDFTTGKSLTPETGQFSYFGGDVSITIDRAINPATGVYSYTGGAVSITYSGLVVRRITNYSVSFEQDWIAGYYEPDWVTGSFEGVE